MRWDTDKVRIDNDVSPEILVEPWHDPAPDPSSAKISLVDLTARGGRRPLDFHDSVPGPRVQATSGRADSVDPLQRLPCSPSVLEVKSQGTAGSTGQDRAEGSPDSHHTFNPGCTLGGVTELGIDSHETEGANLPGRRGRRETCIVNCAIVATSWPHRGGKRFNKPIVVDLDLPVWRGEVSKPP